MAKAIGKKTEKRSVRDGLKKAGRALTTLRRRFNDRLAGKYSPRTAALLTAAAVGVIAAVLLLTPQSVGVADDGSLSDVMKRAGLKCRKMDLEYPTGAYFVRQYLYAAPEGTRVSLLFLMIRWAEAIDSFFTGDNLFDIHFLAALYLVFYLPAVWLATTELIRRVHYASEALVIALLGIFLFGDGAILCYFNSLYPESCWIILLLYIFGLCLAMQSGDRVTREAALIGLGAVGVLIAFVESHCVVITIGVVIFVVRQIMIRGTEFQTRVIAAAEAFVLALSVFMGARQGFSRFTVESKFNAMTTGVLLESKNPAETLEEFGIDGRFEVLTDTSVYQDYPVTRTDNRELKKDFLDQYTVADIGFYYLRHPLQMFSLLSLGVRSSFQMNRTYVGNFERSAGLPERARNVLFTVFSTFTGTTAPRTIGLLVILAVLYAFQFRRTRQRRGRQQTERSRIAALDTFFLAFGLAVGHTLYIVLRSGSSEIERYGTVCGFCIWIMSAMFAAEILHRAGLVRTEDRKG